MRKCHIIIIIIIIYMTSFLQILRIFIIKEKIFLQALVALYRNGSDPEILSMMFNATNSDNKNWFSKNRLIRAPWTDLDSEPQNFFTTGNDYTGRAFYISRNHGGCQHDAGWIVVTFNHCAWEFRLPPITVMYTKRKTYTSWSQYGKKNKETKRFFEALLWGGGGGVQLSLIPVNLGLFIP